MNSVISRKIALRGALLLGATGAIAFGAVEAADAMRMYYVDDPIGRNVVNIESRGQLETMLTRTNDIKADISIDPNNVLNNPRARFVINIASLDTGIALRNEHMLSAEWMNAAQFPTATFELTRVLSPTKKTPLRNGKGSGEVEGDLTLHGVTKKVRAQLEIEAMAQNDLTKTRLPGDLMHIRAQFPLKLVDFGINVPPPAQPKIAPVQQVTVDVFSSTQKPEMPGAETKTDAPKTAENATKGTKMANGLIIEDEKIGDGAEAVPGKKVTVHYRGTLENGTQFDASYDRGEPFQFTLGAGQVIKGWDEGVKGMKIGGKRKLTIPSEMGYGARGAGGVIPPNATLIFEVELLKVG